MKRSSPTNEASALSGVSGHFYTLADFAPQLVAQSKVPRSDRLSWVIVPARIRTSARDPGENGRTLVSPDWVVGARWYGIRCVHPVRGVQAGCDVLGVPHMGDFVDRGIADFIFSIMPRDRPRPLPEKIEILEGAFCPHLDAEHFYVIEHPYTAGVRPLLLVTESRDGARVFKDVLAALPNRVTACKEVPKQQQALFKSVLAVVQQHYKDAVRRMYEFKIIENLPPEFVDDRLCGDALPSWLRRRLENFREEAEGFDVSPRLLASLDDILGYRQIDENGVEPWSPLHLRHCELGSNNTEDWSAFERWEEWGSGKTRSQ